MKLASLFLAAVLAAGVAGSASAAGSQVAVVFNGTTQVNREAFNFLRRNLSQLNPQTTLVAVQDAKTVKPGSYAALVVLNSGQASGVDPVLKAFIDAYPDKKAVFQVNLVKGSKSTAVESVPASANPEGVDAVTAASYWSEGADKMTFIQVHQKWIKALSDFLKTKG